MKIRINKPEWVRRKREREEAILRSEEILTNLEKDDNYNPYDDFNLVQQQLSKIYSFNEPKWYERLAEFWFNPRMIVNIFLLIISWALAGLFTKTLINFGMEEMVINRWVLTFAIFLFHKVVVRNIIYGGYGSI